jgi:hypothetical protein
MVIADDVLSHMDDNSYDVREYSALERLLHSLHMQEVWNAASIQYKKILQNPPSKEKCMCVNDVESNGIMDMLRFIALKVREPELMYGKHTMINGKKMNWEGNIYTYNFAAIKNAEELDAGEPLKHLDSSTVWSQWKKIMVNGMTETDDYELALFLYCILNE